MVETEASDYGIGLVLYKEGHPTAFLSKAIPVNKLVWSTYNKEMLTLIEKVKLWRPYLLGRRFTICTDQVSLHHLLE